PDCGSEPIVQVGVVDERVPAQIHEANSASALLDDRSRRRAIQPETGDAASCSGSSHGVAVSSPKAAILISPSAAAHIPRFRSGLFRQEVISLAPSRFALG